MVRDVSVHYVKIAQIYSAIVLAINPEYEYMDRSNGQAVKKNIRTKSDIPFDQEFSLSKLSFCGSRINSLTERDATQPVCVADANTLEDQMGIPELFDLYCDVDYDEESGQFLAMSNNTCTEYTQSLQRFYQTFTGNKQVPASVKRFGDIPLNRYSHTSVCLPVQSVQSVQSGGALTNDTLLVEYAENLRSMVARVNERQLKLIDMLNSLLTYDTATANATTKRTVRINGNLTCNDVNKISIQCKHLLADLYTSCEVDYLKGIHIYEAIMEKQMLLTTQKQIEYMEKLHEILKHSNTNL